MGILLASSPWDPTDHRGMNPSRLVSLYMNPRQRFSLAYPSFGQVSSECQAEQYSRPKILNSVSETLNHSSLLHYFGPPHDVVTDKLRSYGAAMKVIAKRGARSWIWCDAVVEPTVYLLALL